MFEKTKLKLLDYSIRSACPQGSHLLLLAGLCPEECSSAGQAYSLLNCGLSSALGAARQQRQHENTGSQGRVTREPEKEAIWEAPQCWWGLDKLLWAPLCVFILFLSFNKQSCASCRDVICQAKIFKLLFQTHQVALLHISLCSSEITR